MRPFSALAVVLLVAAISHAQTTQRADPDALAMEVMKAHGIDAWPAITRLRFTFNVEADGKQVMSAVHDWDLQAGTDTVTWNGKTVTVNIASPGDSEDEKAAFARWTNDAYWLLVPLKLMDGGVRRTYEGEQVVDGRTCQVLQLSFDGVGLTPGDRYNLYINPETKLIEAWDYMPNPERKTHFTREAFQNVGGLTLSTDHRSGNRRIYFTDLQAETRR